MVEGGHPAPLFMYPLAMLPGDFKIEAYQPAGRDSPQANNDFRIDQLNLAPPDTGCRHPVLLSEDPCFEAAGILRCLRYNNGFGPGR